LSANNPDERTIVYIPTELERQNAAWDIGVLVVAIPFGFYAASEQGWPVPLVAGLLVLVGLWALTGEPAADVRGVGDLASALRARTGQRRAHEWLLAAAHHWHLAIWPVWVAACVASCRWLQRLTSRWLANANAAIRWNSSRVSSWASSRRLSLSVRRAK
jgi:hypothetical protein